MNSTIDTELDEMEFELRYLQPKDGWQPMCYNIFIEIVERRIFRLREILQEDISESQIKRVNALQQGFLKLQNSED